MPDINILDPHLHVFESGTVGSPSPLASFLYNNMNNYANGFGGL